MDAFPRDLDVDEEAERTPLSMAEELCRAFGWKPRTTKSRRGICTRVKGDATTYTFCFLWDEEDELFTVCGVFPLRVMGPRRDMTRSLLSELGESAKVGRFEIPRNKRVGIFRHSLFTQDLGTTTSQIGVVTRYIFDYCEMALPLVRKVVRGGMTPAEAIQIVEFVPAGEA